MVSGLREQALGGASFQRIGKRENRGDPLLTPQCPERSAKKPRFAVELHRGRAYETAELDGPLVVFAGPPAKYGLRHGHREHGDTNELRSWPPKADGEACS